MRRFLAVLALALSAPSAAAPAPPPGPVAAARWKSEISGGALPGTVRAESWLKGEGRRRTVLTTDVGPSTLLERDGTVWIRTGAMAMKMPASQHRSATPLPVEYVAGLPSLLASGTRLGEETVGGEVCAKWRTSRVRDGRREEAVLWVSPSLAFPLQVEVSTARGPVVIRNRDVDLKGPIEDALFEPEAGVDFRSLPDVLSELDPPAGAAARPSAPPARAPSAPAPTRPPSP